MITFVINSIVLASASTPGVLEPDVKNDSSSTTGPACLSYRPVLLVLEEFNMNLSKLFVDVYSITHSGRLPRDWKLIVAAHSITKSDPGIMPVEKLEELIDGFKSDHEFMRFFMHELQEVKYILRHEY